MGAQQKQQTPCRRSGSGRGKRSEKAIDVYGIITERIIEKLEQGIEDSELAYGEI